MSDKKFIDGMFVENPNSKAPDFVKGKISINAKFIEWYNANKNDKGYVNIDLLESKDGKLYAKHNDFVPKAQTTSKVDVDDNLPF